MPAKNPDIVNWGVQLAKTYTPGMINNNEEFVITQKINGVRATSFGSLQSLVSRSGKLYLGLGNISELLLSMANILKTKTGIDWWFDGELRINPNDIPSIFKQNKPTDNEVFRYSVSIANTRNNCSDKHYLQYLIFDCIPIHVSYVVPYFERRKILEMLQSLLIEYQITDITVLPVLYKGKDTSMIDKQLFVACSNNWEGIMINRNAGYSCTRTNALLKYKMFNTIDLKVIGYTEGTGKDTGVLGALLCDYIGNTVGVGSGFDDATRAELWAKRDTLKGQICEIKYKDITQNQITGLWSLQFPVFVCLKTDKTVSDMEV